MMFIDNAKNLVAEIDKAVSEVYNEVQQPIIPGEVLSDQFFRIKGFIFSGRFDSVQLTVRYDSLPHYNRPICWYRIIDIYAIIPQNAKVCVTRYCPSLYLPKGKILHIWQGHSGLKFVDGPWWDTLKEEIFPLMKKNLSLGLKRLKADEIAAKQREQDALEYAADEWISSR